MARFRPLRRSRVLALAVGVTAVAALGVPAGATAVTSSATTAATATTETTAQSPEALVLRVSRPTARQLDRLTAVYDLLEVRRGDDYFVMGDAATASALRTEGFRVSVDRRLPRLASAAESATKSATTSGDGSAAAYPTFYGGYHTVVAHRQHLADVAAARPDLATVVDYGDSWLKTRNRGGHDLLAICLTKKGPGDCALSPSAPKPRSVVYAGIHARELATSEIAWNWIDHLVGGYGGDPTVTSMLDTTEVWVIPVANPDGRQIVESGGNSPYYQRKNANDSRGWCSRPPTSSNHHGVDLNRNATWAYGGAGTSIVSCSQTYRGTGAASEPETKAQQALFDKLFADRRGTARTAAAPADTTGTFMSYHSYGGLILFPWGDTATDAPNGAKLRALAQRMAQFNGYTIGQGSEVLYATTGTTDDDLYGRLGVASFTTELGAAGTNCDGFMPPYSCVGSRFWPQERQVLTVLTQAAHGPYR